MAGASEVGAGVENEEHSTGAIMPAGIRAPTTASLSEQEAGFVSCPFTAAGGGHEQKQVPSTAFPDFCRMFIKEL